MNWLTLFNLKEILCQNGFCLSVRKSEGAIDPFVRKLLRYFRRATPDIEYASGLTIGKYRGLNAVAHGGANHGYRSDFISLPEQQFAVACLRNTFTNAQRITRAIADLYLGGQMKDNTPDADSRALTRPTIIDLRGVDLDVYAGDHYSEELQITLRFIVENDQLKLFGRKSNDPAAYPIAVDHFFLKPGMELAFTRDAQKRVTGFTLANRAQNWSGTTFNGMTFTRMRR